MKKLHFDIRMLKETKKILFIVNVDWFFISHRLPLAIEARNQGYDVHIATSNTGKFCELKALGFNVYDLKIDRKGTNPFAELNTIFVILKLLYRLKPHILHNITLKISIYGSIASRFIRVPKIINSQIVEDHLDFEK